MVTRIYTPAILFVLSSLISPSDSVFVTADTTDFRVVTTASGDYAL